MNYIAYSETKLVIILSKKCLDWKVIW